MTSDSGPGPSPGRQPRPHATLANFLLLTWLALLLNEGRVLGEVSFVSVLQGVWAPAVLLTYTFFQVLCALAPALLLALALRVDALRRLAGRLPVRPGVLPLALALLGASVLQLLAWVDVVIHGMYGFHLNGFVWNLLTTEGGIESLGASGATQATFAAIAAGIVLAQALLLVLAARSRRVDRLLAPLRRRRGVLLGFLLLVLLSAFEKATYGLADVRNERSVLKTSRVIPFYAHTNIRRFAKRMGWMAERTELKPLKLSSSELHYPLAPLVRAPGSPNLNIVWLVAESLRDDALDPEVMPDTAAFAARSLSFRHHYSGGNGTRMGIFSMFYGLYGAYWFSFLSERRGPALIDLLLDAGYEITARTSAKFTYPEFDSTVWVAIPNDHLHEGDPDVVGWQNDRHHVADLLADLDARDPDRPFMQFLFFESAHARYYFPPESVIVEPYLEEMNYATMDTERDIELIHNRYINSCHHLDSQLGRVFDGLEQRGLLDSTVVIVTGDHGEEFMEKGNWGHHSTFSEESTRVPLVLYVPGQAAGQPDQLTSHLDIVPTLMTLLGVTNSIGDYALGDDLLGPVKRESCVVADWERLAVIAPWGKGVFPVTGSDFTSNYVTTLDDAPVEDPGEWYGRSSALMSQVMKNLGRFMR